MHHVLLQAHHEQLTLRTDKTSIESTGMLQVACLVWGRLEFETRQLRYLSGNLDVKALLSVQTLNHQVKLESTSITAYNHTVPTAVPP